MLLKDSIINEQELNFPVEELDKSNETANITGKTITNVVSGKFLVSESAISNLPFIIYLALTGLCYIGMGYYSQERTREIAKVTEEIRELNSQYRAVTDNLMYIRKEKEVVKAASPIGLNELTVPPIKIILKNR